MIPATIKDNEFKIQSTPFMYTSPGTPRIAGAETKLAVNDIATGIGFMLRLAKRNSTLVLCLPPIQA